jgi:hypothetical protein
MMGKAAAAAAGRKGEGKGERKQSALRHALEV